MASCIKLHPTCTQYGCDALISHNGLCHQHAPKCDQCHRAYARAKSNAPPLCDSCWDQTVAYCSCGIHWDEETFLAEAGVDGVKIMADGDGGWLLLFNCTCKSTISVGVVRS